MASWLFHLLVQSGLTISESGNWPSSIGKSVFARRGIERKVFSRTTGLIRSFMSELVRDGY